MSADRPRRRREAFARYAARWCRELLLVHAHAHGLGWQHRMVWYETSLEAAMLPDPDLARAVEAMGRVRPSITAPDIWAVWMHALVQEVRRRHGLSGHGRLAEAIQRRRLVDEAILGEVNVTPAETAGGRPKVRRHGSKTRRGNG